MTAAADSAYRQPVTLLICALGGEGGGVLSEWLVDAAARAGHAAQSTSIPGVAQRTGATTYYVEVFPVPIAQLNGKRPVFSLYPVPGSLDLIVSSELLETVRQIGNGMSTKTRTRIITSSSRSLTTNERMQLADGRIPAAPLLETVANFSLAHHVFDMGAMTRETGTVVSAVMFGAVAASGLLPFGRDECEAVVRAGGKGTEASLAGFARAFERISRERLREAYVELVGPDATPAAPPVAAPASPRAHALPEDIKLRFPASTQPMLELGWKRLCEYQGSTYASLYAERMARVLEAEQRADPGGAHDHAITRESARYLALWMAFDDIVRVADLKARASRADRVRREVKVSDGELLRVLDYFKPGVPEVAALLPAAIGERLLRWDRRRQSAGKPPLALPLKVGTHTVTGMIALRWLASLRPMRRAGMRYRVEQALIERWLHAIDSGARAHWELGHEIALCGRLIKGYGSTNESGKENLLHIIDHLAIATEIAAPARAAAIHSARIAALADEAGTALDRTLVEHGAPKRPVKAVPIRFERKPRAQPVASGD
jgi:indolepyruvate ferredoxin oxidoreductase beta subunit